MRHTTKLTRIQFRRSSGRILATLEIGAAKERRGTTSVLESMTLTYCWGGAQGLKPNAGSEKKLARGVHASSLPATFETPFSLHGSLTYASFRSAVSTFMEIHSSPSRPPVQIIARRYSCTRLSFIPRTRSALDCWTYSTRVILVVSQPVRQDRSQPSWEY